MGVLDRLLPITRVTGENGLVSINNKSLLFLPLFLSLPLRLLRTLALEWCSDINLEQMLRNIFRLF